MHLYFYLDQVLELQKSFQILRDIWYQAKKGRTWIKQAVDKY